MTISRRKHTLTALVPVVALLLVYMLSRTYHVLALPPFLDESEQIDYGQAADVGHWLSGANNGRMAGGWWVGVFQPSGDAALWLNRVASILFVLISIAAIYSVATKFTSAWGGIMATLLYILMPFALFHDRLGISDPYASVFGALTLWFAVRFVAQQRTLDALLSGLMITAAILGKATGILLTVIPVTLFVILIPLSRWRQSLRGVVAAYGAFALSEASIYLYLRSLGDNYFSVPTNGSIGTASLSGLSDRLLSNLQTIRLTEVDYLSKPFLIAVVVLILYLIIRRPRIGITMATIIALPIAGLIIFGLKISGRYMMFHLPLLAICLGIALAVLTNDLQRYVRLAPPIAQLIPLLLIGVWALGVALPFASAMYSNPASQMLPPHDEYEYLEHDASGYGINEAAAYLIHEQTTVPEPIHVIGLLSNCRGLEHIVPSSSGVVVECPGIHSDGSRQTAIAAQTNQEAAAAKANHLDLWLVTEQLPFVSMDGITAPYKEVASFNRPGNFTHVILYHFLSSQ